MCLWWHLLQMGQHRADQPWKRVGPDEPPTGHYWGRPSADLRCDGLAVDNAGDGGTLQHQLQRGSCDPTRVVFGRPAEDEGGERRP